MPAHAASDAALARTTARKSNSESTFRLSAAFLAAFEFRFALLAECAKAFPAVFGSDETIVGFDLKLHGRGETPVQTRADRVLRLPHRERSERGDVLSRPQRFLHQLAGLAELVHETPSVCFLRGKWAGRQNELLGASLADDAGQRLRAAAARHDPERHFRKRKCCRLRRVGKIAVQDELQTACVGGAVYCGYHRDRTIAHRAKHALEYLVLRAPLSVAERTALLQIGAGAKRLVPGAGDDNAPVRLYGQEALEKFTQLERRSGVEGVGDLGTVEGHKENSFRLFLHPQRGVLFHACSRPGDSIPGHRAHFGRFRMALPRFKA